MENHIKKISLIIIKSVWKLPEKCKWFFFASTFYLFLKDRFLAFSLEFIHNFLFTLLFSRFYQELTNRKIRINWKTLSLWEIMFFNKYTLVNICSDLSKMCIDITTCLTRFYLFVKALFCNCVLFFAWWREYRITPNMHDIVFIIHC